MLLAHSTPPWPFAEKCPRDGAPVTPAAGSTRGWLRAHRLEIRKKGCSARTGGAATPPERTRPRGPLRVHIDDLVLPSGPLSDYTDRAHRSAPRADPILGAPSHLTMPHFCILSEWTAESPERVAFRPATTSRLRPCPRDGSPVFRLDKLESRSLPFAGARRNYLMNIVELFTCSRPRRRVGWTRAIQLEQSFFDFTKPWACAGRTAGRRALRLHRLRGD